MSVYLRRGRYYYRKRLGGVQYNMPLGLKKGQERLLSARTDQIEQEILSRHYGLDIPAPAGAVTLAEYSERYISESTDKKTTGIETLRLRKMVSIIGDVPLGSVGERDIRRIERTLLDQKRSTTTVNRYMEILRHMFNRAMGERLVRENPVRRYYQSYVEERARRALTVDETRRVMAAARGIQENAKRPGPRSCIYDIMSLGLLTGMRLSEILNLRRDYVRGEVISYPYSQTKSRRRLPGGKRVGAKVIALNGEAREIIERRSVGPGEYVFNLKRRDWKMLRGVTPAIRRLSGVSDFSFHYLRHTVATLIASALPLAVAKEVLGHSDLKTTLGYTHPELADKARGGAILGNAFKNIVQK